MVEKELNEEYFNWMCQLVSDDKNNRGLSYRKLLNHLHSIEFKYVMPMDGNRADDGIDLRYLFGYEEGYPSHMISKFIDNRPCSVLEMIIALAYRCETHIMSDPDVGDRVHQWFWTMIDSLDLSEMDNIHYDESVVDNAIYRFMNREYDSDGKGGLFTVKQSKYDMRTVEIWWQMNWYLDSILEQE